MLCNLNSYRCYSILINVTTLVVYIVSVNPLNQKPSESPMLVTDCLSGFPDSFTGTGLRVASSTTSTGASKLVRYTLGYGRSRSMGWFWSHRQRFSTTCTWLGHETRTWTPPPISVVPSTSKAGSSFYLQIVPAQPSSALQPLACASKWMLGIGNQSSKRWNWSGSRAIKLSWTCFVKRMACWEKGIVKCHIYI